ncbi:MAG: VOC family protein [Bacillota bacterium]
MEHTAIWVKDLDGMKDFYCKYFDGTPNKLYHNPDKQFKSYFISFKAGTRLELMHMPGIPDNQNNIKSQYKGIIHIAFSVGSKKQVDELTARLKEDGHCMVSEPRTTGDGYYESCVLDPEGNIIEITI